MKLKRTMSAILAAAITLGCSANVVLAAVQPTEQNEAQAVPVGPQKMTIDDAIEFAKSNSLSYASNIAAAKSNEYTAKESDKTYRNYNDSDNILSQLTTSSFDMYLLRMGYVLKASELQLRASQRACDNALYKLKTDVKNKFYTYLNTVEKVNIAQSSLDSAKTRLEQAKQRKVQGIASEIEVKTFEVSVISAENALEQANRAKEYALDDLKNLIGYKYDNELIISGSFTRDTSEVLKPEEVIAKLPTNPDVQSLDETLELAAERFKYAQRWYFARENGYWVEKYTFDKAQSDHDANIDSMKLGIKNLYNNILTINEGIATLEANIDLMKTNVEASKLQYELGMITVQDYVDTVDKYTDLQNQLVDLELTELVTKLSYKSFYTFEQ